MSSAVKFHIFVAFILTLLFVHFAGAGARTFKYNPNLDEGGAQAEIYFTVAVLVVALMGVYYRIERLHGIASLCLVGVSLALYEWARRTIRGRGLSVIKSETVAESVVTTGPYAYIRHPFYLSYMIASVAVLAAFPVIISVIGVVANLLFFVRAARTEERSLAQSALAPAYEEYRNRTGMFLPWKRKSPPTTRQRG